jgi:hypothetical protein
MTQCRRLSFPRLAIVISSLQRVSGAGINRDCPPAVSDIAYQGRQLCRCKPIQIETLRQWQQQSVARSENLCEMACVSICQAMNRSGVGIEYVPAISSHQTRVMKPS